MKRVNLILGLIAFIRFAIMVTGCKKENDIQLEDKNLSQDDAYAESSFENVSDMADGAFDIIPVAISNRLKGTGYSSMSAPLWRSTAKLTRST